MGKIFLIGFCATFGRAEPVFSLNSIKRSEQNSQKNNWSYYRQLGLNYRNQKLYPQAITALEKSSALAPNDINGKIILGWTLHLAGYNNRAQQTLLQAIYLDPFSVRSFNALGIVYLVQDDLPLAILAHSWAAILKPNNEIAYYNLSLAYHRQNIWGAAIITADKAIQLEQDNPHPVVAKALSIWSRGDRVTAQRVFRMAISLDSRYSDLEFLNYLNEAGFSAAQIALSKQILKSLR